jgi:predicted permease
VLALAGGACGLLFAGWTTGLLTTFVARFTPRTGEIALDIQVLLLTAVVSVLTGLVFGTFPAMASSADLVAAMKQGSTGAGVSIGRRWVQSALVVAQVAVSVVLLAGAGLLIASFYRLQRVDPGYNGDRVMSAELFTNFSKYPNVDTQRRFYLPLIERLEAQPGVVSVAVTNAVPLRVAQAGNAAFQIEGRVEDNPERRPTADARIVSAGFFRTLGVPLVAGRTFTVSDTAESMRVVVINRAMTRYWDTSEPIGSRISLDAGRTWSTVVGVVGNVRDFGLDRDPVPQLYTPLRQTRQNLNGLVLVRTSGDPASAIGMIRDAAWALDPEMPVQNVRTLDEIRDRYLATPKLTAVLLSVFAVLALVVTMAGITGVMATSVSQRTQEFGIRMALGASRTAVLRMVIGHGLALVAAGLVVGVLASTLATRVLASYLFDTNPVDPLMFLFVGAAFALVGVVASIGPAWRATTVDPMLAVRAE